MLLIKNSLFRFFIVIGLCYPFVFFEFTTNGEPQLNWTQGLGFLYIGLHIQVILLLIQYSHHKSFGWGVWVYIALLFSSFAGNWWFELDYFTYALLISQLLWFKTVPKRIQIQSVSSPSFVRYWLKHQQNFTSFALLVLLIAMPFLPFQSWFGISSRYWLDVMMLIMTYTLLAWGLSILVGSVGLLDLGYVGFYAVGGYTYAYLALHLDMSFWSALPLVALVSLLTGLLLGYPVLGMRGDYFAIVTLGFGEIIRIVLINWSSLTGGLNGLGNIPKIDLFGYFVFSRQPINNTPTFHDSFGLAYSTEHRLVFLYYLILGLMLLLYCFHALIKRLPIHLGWEAIAEDDIATNSLGIHKSRLKMIAFALAGMWGGIAGSFFAVKQGFLSPENFIFQESVLILAIVILGQRNNLLLIGVAAFFMIGIPELLRELSAYRYLVFGALLVLTMQLQTHKTKRQPSLRFSLNKYQQKGGRRG